MCLLTLRVQANHSERKEKGGAGKAKLFDFPETRTDLLSQLRLWRVHWDSNVWEERVWEVGCRLLSEQIDVCLSQNMRALTWGLWGESTEPADALRV